MKLTADQKREARIHFTGLAFQEFIRIEATRNGQKLPHEILINNVVSESLRYGKALAEALENAE